MSDMRQAWTAKAAKEIREDREDNLM